MVKPIYSVNGSYTEMSSEFFYTELLRKALEAIPPEGSVMVVGPMFVLRSPEENFEIFRAKQAELQSLGRRVFDQIPFLDYYLENPPFNYEKKFEIFYKGLIKSGKIIEIYVLPDYKESQGTMTEILYAEQSRIPVYYIQSR